MAKAKKAKKRNPTDATMRNVRSSGRRLDEQGRAIVRLSRRLAALEARVLPDRAQPVH